jgi:hypothetical protein
MENNITGPRVEYMKQSLEKIDSLTFDVKSELSVALLKFPPMNSAHEGYAVIKEELDELWHEIKNDKAEGQKERMRNEAIQLTAMCFRFLNDLL